MPAHLSLQAPIDRQSIQVIGWNIIPQFLHCFIVNFLTVIISASSLCDKKPCIPESLPRTTTFAYLKSKPYPPYVRMTAVSGISRLSRFSGLIHSNPARSGASSRFPAAANPRGRQWSRLLSCDSNSSDRCSDPFSGLGNGPRCPLKRKTQTARVSGRGSDGRKTIVKVAHQDQNPMRLGSRLFALRHRATRLFCGRLNHTTRVRPCQEKN